MALLAITQPTSVGVLAAPAAVSASDTINQASLGSRGACLKVINGNASADVVAISDSGNSPAGNAASSSGGSVANGTAKWFYISPFAANTTTGVVTVTHSVNTTVTYELIPLG